MVETVVVLGAGYAGAGAISKLQSRLDEDAKLIWIADNDYHLVLHESHRLIRDPDVRSDITISVYDIIDPATRFIEDQVTNLDVDNQVVELKDNDDVDFDYVLVCLGSQTAYYGIPGLEENSLTLKSLDDALEIHNAIDSASKNATRSDPAQVVIGGAGLSGIQTAGEVAEFRDKHRANVEIHLVEALEEIFPGNDPEIQQELRALLEETGVRIHTDDPITEAEDGIIHFDTGESLEYDVFVWTGGITGREAFNGTSLENQHNRVNTEANFQTSNKRVFAIGDSAIVDQGDHPAPPTAQAAWQGAAVAGENIARSIENRPLKTWEYTDKGTVVSVGDKAVAHNVKGLPITTFGGFAARNLKKFIAAKWIAELTTWNRARKSWPTL
ncbi:NAD(P)/FAD-dependent oxidoreductase [Natrialbaceae archaeon A-CW2]